MRKNPFLLESESEELKKGATAKASMSYGEWTAAQDASINDSSTCANISVAGMPACLLVAALLRL
eukprot:scaffold401515_cov19-Prasinocladus_malaysianus.AAC.1